MQDPKKTIEPLLDALQLINQWICENEQVATALEQQKPRQSGERDELQHATELAMQFIQLNHQMAAGQSAAGSGHELNQPLMAISTTAEDIYWRTVEKIELPQAQLQEMMQDVLRMVERLQQTIERLHIAAQDPSDEPESRFSINEVMHSALQLLQAQLKNRGIELRLNLDENLPLVAGHFHQLEQVVVNLLARSRDALEAPSASDPATRTIFIGTHLSANAGNGLVVEIAASGESIERTRADSPSPSPLAGTADLDIGLFLARTIALRHGGRLTCERPPGEGLIFRIHLPVSPED